MAQAREVRIVEMEDGRKVEFAGKRKMLKDTDILVGGNPAVRFDFANGKTRTYTVPDQHLIKSAAHGLGQKLGDNVAGLKSEDGSPADEDDMLMEIDDLYQRLSTTSDWNVVSKGGSFAGASILARAIAEVKGKAIDEVKAFLKSKVDAGMTYAALNAAFERNPEVGPVMKRMKDEKAAKGPQVNTDEILAGV